MNGTDQFKRVIKGYLDNRAKTDELFAESYAKENKNIDDCVKFILDMVKKSGRCGFADEEIYSLAVHYYDEDDLNFDASAVMENCQIVVNTNEPIELTEEEKAQARKEAIAEYKEAEIRKIQNQFKKTDSKTIKANKEKEEAEIIHSLF